MKRATDQLHMPFASVSIIERSAEFVIAGNQYKSSYMPRDPSLAAHAILSREVMEICDATKVRVHLFNLRSG